MYIRMCIMKETSRKNGRLADTERMRRNMIHLSRIRKKWNFSCRAVVSFFTWYAINLLFTNNNLLIFYQCSRNKHAKYTSQITNKSYRSLARINRGKHLVYISAYTNALRCIAYCIHIIVLRYNYERWRGRPIVIRTSSDQRVCAYVYAATF